MKIQIILMGVLTLLLLTMVDAAETKKDLPNDVVSAAKDEVIKMGISESYFDKHFSLKYSNVDSWSATEGWESGEIAWVFNVNEEFSIEYIVRVDKVGERFKVTEDYVIRDGIAYLFPTKSLHEFKQLISKAEAEKKLEGCLGLIETSSVFLSKGGGLFLMASARKGDYFYEGVVNLETGELTCSGPKPMYEDVGQEPGSKGQEPVKTGNMFQKFWAWLKSLFSTI